MKGCLLRILLTGIDGSGKSTAARELVNAVTAQGSGAVLLRTPGGRRTMDAWWSALGWGPSLRLQDSAESMVRLVNAVLNQIRVRRYPGLVVVDRGLICQLALREARGLPRGVILPLLLRFVPAPDVVAHFDLPVEVALDRVRIRATDMETSAGLLALERGYRALPEFTGFTLVNADRPTEDVVHDLLVLAGYRATHPSASTLSFPSGGVLQKA